VRRASSATGGALSVIFAKAIGVGKAQHSAAEKRPGFRRVAGAAQIVRHERSGAQFLRSRTIRFRSSIKPQTQGLITAARRQMLALPDIDEVCGFMISSSEDVEHLLRF
jgi:hypothetical protein